MKEWTKSQVTIITVNIVRLHGVSTLNIRLYQLLHQNRFSNKIVVKKTWSLADVPTIPGSARVKYL